MTSKMTIEFVDTAESDGDAIAYNDGGFFVLRERSEYVGRDYCFVYLRRGQAPPVRLSGPLDGLMPAIALIERIKKEDAAKAA